MHAQKVDVDPHEGLVDDMQPGMGQQGMDIGHPAIGRIFDRQHAQIDLARAGQVDHVFEGRAGHRLHIRAATAGRPDANRRPVRPEKRCVLAMCQLLLATKLPEKGQLVALLHLAPTAWEAGRYRANDGHGKARHVRHDDDDQGCGGGLRRASGLPAGQLGGATSIYATGGGRRRPWRRGRTAQAYTIDTGAAEGGEAAEEAPAVDVAALLAAADAAAGEKVFGKCKSCHKIDGGNGTGPHLNGVVGRAKAAVAGFGYSDVLAGMAADAWTPENAVRLPGKPQGAYAPGTKMTFAGLPKPEDRANVIAYLATLPDRDR